MPHPPEIHRLVLPLQHADDLRVPLDPLDERVLDWCAQEAGESEELCGREALVPEEEDLVLEPGGADVFGG